jgi:hypothetical protein
MPGPNFVLDKGYLAETAIGQFRVVKHGTVNESATAVTAAGDLPLGVCQEECSADHASRGRVVNVRKIGTSRCIAGAILGRGVRVRAGADGRVVALAGAAGAGENLVGVTETASTAANDHIDVFLTIGATS